MQTVEATKPSIEEVTRSCVETESIETGLRKTRGSSVASPTSSLSPVGSNSVRSTGSVSRSASAGSCGHVTPRGGSMARENSNLSRCSSGSRTPRDGNSSPEGSPLKRASAGRNSLRKPPAPPAPTTLGKSSNHSRNTQQTTSCDSTSSPRAERHNANNNSNTWNGRQTRQRPTMTTDTFVKPSKSTNTNCTKATSTSSPTNFSRKNPARQSLPRLGTNNSSSPGGSNGTGVQYDRNGRRIKSNQG